jgi:type IV secretory pathway VirB10-like protein
MKASHWIALAALACPSAGAVNKCLVDGQVTYQDAACLEARETVAQGIERKQRIGDFHRRLDKMQARGVGLVQRAPPPPSPPRPEDKAPSVLGHGRESPAQRAAIMARLTAQTLEKNERSRQALVEQLNAVNEFCDGKLVDLPVVGMRDETFRNCTLHARFGGATQIVAVEEDGVPLRLYVFPRGRAERVYSVDGVVTAVKP